MANSIAFRFRGDSYLGAYCLPFWFLADRGAHFSDQFWRKYFYPVCLPAVFRSLVQDFLFGCAACLKVAVHAYFPASNDLCHVRTLQMTWLCKG